MVDVVIGSGPAGLAAVMALRARGRAVLVIDGGADLEPEAEAARARMASVDPTDWDGAALEAFKAPNRTGIRRYGSDFALAPEDAFLDAAEPGIELRGSMAQGGLSALWGAAVQPWSAADMAGWPVDLGPHYRAVSEFMPIAGAPFAREEADLAFAPALPRTAQADRLLSRLNAASASGFQAGPARQAVAAGCRSCGLCLYGCPWSLIYSTRPVLKQLIGEGAVTYRAARVERLEPGRVYLKGETDPIQAENTYLAAGVLGTAQILFASLQGLDQLTLRESAHMFTPFLSSWGAKGVGAGPHHTLTQAFAQIDDPEVSPHRIHTQIYGWNDHYAREMADSYGRGISALNPLFRALSRRLIVAQTFLHSDHCHGIVLRPANGRLSAHLATTPGFDETARRARARLARGLRPAGLYPIMRAARSGAPGSSFHLGALMPMTVTPGVGQTDPLGRPKGWESLHIVDASVMPAIPASTITLSVMANAHRIATHV
jgi:choline dehydrogenase-like flavoprotein